MKALHLIAASILVAACGGKGTGEAADPRAGGRNAAGRVVPVEVTEARTDTVVDAILATGQIEAVQSIELRPEVEGRLVGALRTRRVTRNGVPSSDRAAPIGTLLPS